MLDSNGDSGPPCGVPSVDGDRRAVRHHDARFQHPAHQGQHPPIAHPLGEPIEKTLVVDPIEELRQVNVHHRPTAGFQMLLRFGDRRVSASVADGSRGCSGGRSARRSAPKSGARPAEPPIHHVGNAQPPQPAAGLRQPDPANLAGPIAFPQQRLSQAGDERGGVALRRPPPSARLFPALPCCVRHSAAPAPNSPRTPLPPAADSQRARRRWLGSRSWAVPYAAKRRARRIRPANPSSSPPCGLSANAKPN